MKRDPIVLLRMHMQEHGRAHRGRAAQDRRRGQRPIVAGRVGLRRRRARSRRSRRCTTTCYVDDDERP